MYCTIPADFCHTSVVRLLQTHQLKVILTYEQHVLDTHTYVILWLPTGIIKPAEAL